MKPIKLAQEIEERYRRYLKTTFYFRDPLLRASFEGALGSGRLSKGPYLEATPIFKRGAPPRDLFKDLLGAAPEQGFLKAVQGERPLYRHQEESIRRVFKGHNAVVATGTGSGKTEAFLYPILLHLYQEFQARELCPCVRALVLYPMNTLANDQRERLGEICRQLKEANSYFRFTFGQYIGETPEHENDSPRHARDHLAERDRKGCSIVENGRIVHGELVLRSEMRSTPPHILLTNYSMLEYLLLRPDDRFLFDDGRAQWWTFLVLDEAHQYRGARGIEMAMLLRRLKQRLREGGRGKPFVCSATSATLVGGKGDKSAVAKFASDLFGEPFNDRDVILGDVEAIPQSGVESLGREHYQSLSYALEGGAEATWRATEDGKLIETAMIPAREDIYFQYLYYLLETQHMDEAAEVWDRLLEPGFRFEPKAAFPYLDALIQQRRIDQLTAAWANLLERNPTQIRKRVTDPNLITNGGFESEILNGGLDWRVIPTEGVVVGVDSATFLDGVRSLRVQFDGKHNLNYEHIYQYVPVEPNTSYRFMGYMRAQGITTDSGPRLQVYDAYDSAKLFLQTDNLTATSSWSLQQLEFKTGADTRLLAIRVARPPSRKFENQIAGTVWVDRVALNAVE